MRLAVLILLLWSQGLYGAYVRVPQKHISQPQIGLVGRVSGHGVGTVFKYHGYLYEIVRIKDGSFEAFLIPLKTNTGKGR